jgi:hypothetical protein
MSRLKNCDLLLVADLTETQNDGHHFAEIRLIKAKKEICLFRNHHFFFVLTVRVAGRNCNGAISSAMVVVDCSSDSVRRM